MAIKLPDVTSKRVYGIMRFVLGGCALESILKYSTIWNEANVTFADIIQRTLCVFLLTVFALMSLSFYKNFISFLKESKWGSYFCIIISGLFGGLLWYSANWTIYWPIPVAFFLLYIKALQLYLKVKKDNCDVVVVSYFRRYVYAYFLSFIATSLLIANDLKYLSITNFFQRILHPQEATESKILINGLKQIKNSNPKIDVETLIKAAGSLNNKYTSAVTITQIAIFIGAAALILYYLFDYIITPFLFRKRDIKLQEELIVIEKLKKHYSSHHKEEIQSQFISIISLTRPLVSIIAGLISSRLYYIYTHDLSLSIILFCLTFLTTSFGFTINDFFDVEKDKIDHPKRALSLGLIKPKTALISSIFFALISIILSLYISKYIISINLLTITLLSFYSVINNNNGVWANIVSAFTASLVLIIAKIDFSFDLTVVSAISCFLFVLSREIIFDIQDIKGDTSVGKSSIPILYGVKKSYKIVGILLFLNTMITISGSIFYKNNIYLLLIGIFSNILIWGSFLVYVKKKNKAAENIYLWGTRLVFCLLILTFYLNNHMH